MEGGCEAGLWLQCGVRLGRGARALTWITCAAASVSSTGAAGVAARTRTAGADAWEEASGSAPVASVVPRQKRMDRSPATMLSTYDGAFGGGMTVGGALTSAMAGARARSGHRCLR